MTGTTGFARAPTPTLQSLYNRAMSLAQQRQYCYIMKLLCRFVAAGCLFASIATAPAEGGSENDREAAHPPLQALYSEMRALFLKHYPKATAHLLNGKMHFEHDTRIFIVHEPRKTGEWQDPWETRGPKPGGILCDITLQEGRYMGAAIVPQTFDKRYFSVLLMAPYSAKHDRHLNVHLSCPGNVKPEFLNEFTQLVNDFSKHLN